MSNHEVVQSYLGGGISRRTLIRRLAAGGVSLGAAVSYAQVLNPENAQAAGSALAVDDHYPAVDLAITTTTFAQAFSERRILLKTTSSEELNLVFIEVFIRQGGGLHRIGSRSFPTFLTAAGTKTVQIPIDRTRLAGRTQAKFYAYLQGRDAEHWYGLATTSRVLS